MLKIFFTKHRETSPTTLLSYNKTNIRVANSYLLHPQHILNNLNKAKHIVTEQNTIRFLTEQTTKMHLMITYLEHTLNMHKLHTCVHQTNYKMDKHYNSHYLK